MYVDGFVTPIPKANREAYLKHIEEVLPLLRDYGLLRMVDAWQDDVPKGEVTDYFKAAQATEDEAIVFSWFEWPSKEVRDAGVEKMMKDPRMQDLKMPFDAKRVIYGGFQTISDVSF